MARVVCSACSFDKESKIARLGTTCCRRRANERGDSLCPHCYGHVPPSATTPPLPLTIADRMAGHGFRVQIAESGLRPNLEIETPEGLIYDGPEPGAALTRLGAMLALALPIVAAAFGLLFALFGRSMPLPVLLLVAMGLSLFFGGLIYTFWPQRPVRRRLIAAAWDVLVPDFLAQPLPEAAVAFIGSLATATHGHFFPDDDVLQETVDAVKNAASDGPALAALYRLQDANAVQHGEDETIRLAERIGDALAGNMPLRLLGPLLADPEERWPRGRLLRLQALVCGKAADLGLQDADFVDFARAQPALRVVFGSGDLDHLAQLRLFCALRQRWPTWIRQANNVFDLVADPASETLLADRPDLLFASRHAPIYVGTRGVWLKDVCLTEQPRQIAVVQSRDDRGSGYEIIAGNQHVWFSANPNKIADELEIMLKFYYVDFLPQWTKAPAPRTAAATRVWRANATACPECHRPVVPVAGEVGLRAAEPEEQLAS